jgi:SAM-dependent methyltransferase
MERTEADGAGERFEFGENWSRFARDLAPERIDGACESLVAMLGRPSLEGVSFLDAGSGSGLFSLAAARLGATRIHSFDYDPTSVATTEDVRRRFAPGANWTVARGSVLDADYMGSLGSWDVVYSWGVLHHTGDLWRGFELVGERVAPEGLLFVSIYNDQGIRSDLWRAVKRLYNRLPDAIRPAYVVLASLPIEVRVFARHLLSGRPDRYLRLWGSENEERGMSRWHDLVDWVGGYPFEVAVPEQVLEHAIARGFGLRQLRTVGGSNGCNEFVFERRPALES